MSIHPLYIRLYIEETTCTPTPKSILNPYAGMTRIRFIGLAGIARTSQSASGRHPVKI